MSVGDTKRFKGVLYTDRAHRSTVAGATYLADRLIKTDLFKVYVTEVRESGVGIKPYFRVWVAPNERGKKLSHAVLERIIKMEMM